MVFRDLDSNAVCEYNKPIQNSQLYLDFKVPRDQDSNPICEYNKLIQNS